MINFDTLGFQHSVLAFDLLLCEEAELRRSIVLIFFPKAIRTHLSHFFLITDT